MECGARGLILRTHRENKAAHPLGRTPGLCIQFADLGGAKLPEGVKLDGRSFAPQLRGENGTPRDWVYVQLGDKWCVRDQGFKLTSSGELLDMSDAPFAQKIVPADSAYDDAKAARVRLKAVLDKLSPDRGKAVGVGKQVER